MAADLAHRTRGSAAYSSSMSARHDPATHVQLAFFRDGHLTTLPSRSSYRLAALAVLAERFEPGHRYAEREVSAILAEDAPDPTTLRRLLVDHGMLSRAAGEYWRDR
jgi:hypothetical protein